MTRSDVLKQMRIWHRRLGLILSVWLFVLALTGIALSHTTDLSLDTRRIHNEFLLSLYGIEVPTLQSYQVGDRWFSQVGGDRLYINDIDTARCPALKGALPLAGGAVIACGDDLLIFDRDGQLMERLGAIHGLPTPLDALGHCQGSLCLRSGSDHYLLSPGLVDWPATTADFLPVSPNEPPTALSVSLEAVNLPADIHWERLLLDLHSGRFAGLGPWLSDIFAIGIIILALAGIVIWRNNGNRKN